MDALLAFAAALLALRLAGLLAARYRSSRRPELFAWAAGLAGYETLCITSDQTVLTSPGIERYRVS